MKLRSGLISLAALVFVGACVASYRSSEAAEGDLYSGAYRTSRPACSELSGMRGRMWAENAADGTVDSFYVCLRLADLSYAWTEILIGSTPDLESLTVEDLTVTVSLIVGTAGSNAITRIYPVAVTGTFGTFAALGDCQELTGTQSGILANRPCAMSNGSLTAQGTAGLDFSCDTDTNEVNVVACCRKSGGCSGASSATYYPIVFNWTP